MKLKSDGFIKINDLSINTLVKAAKMELRTKYFDNDLFDRINRISDLEFVDSRVMYIPLVKKRLSSTSEPIPVPNGGNLPASTLETWTKAISDLDPYSISDLSTAGENFLLQYHWCQLIDRFWRIIEISSIMFNRPAPNSVKQKKLSLLISKIGKEALNNLYPRLVELASRVSEVSLGFYYGEEILKQVSSVIEKAKEFVIIGSSFASIEGIKELLTKVKPLRDKGIKVLFLWGKLGKEIVDLKSYFPIFEEEWISFRPAITTFHSKFIIIDNKISWITSCNLLSNTFNHDGPKEMICEISGGSNIGYIFEYAYSKLSKNFDERTWFEQYTALPSMTFQKDMEEKILEFKECLQAVQNLSESLLTEITNAKISELREYFDTINELRSYFLNKVVTTMVENLDHRKLLRSVLSNATKEVKIGTDNVYEKALGPVLLDAFEEAINNDVSIEIEWGRNDPSSISEELLENRRKGVVLLKERFNNKITVKLEPSRSHAKYLIMDNDFLLVTSFNLLAFAGNGLSDTDVTDELGIAISSKNIRDKIITDNS